MMLSKKDMQIITALFRHKLDQLRDEIKQANNALLESDTDIIHVINDVNNTNARIFASKDTEERIEKISAHLHATA